jgi:hypothetical protein
MAGPAAVAGRSGSTKVRSTTHLRGTTANGDTIGGVAPGGSQRRRRSLSWRYTTPEGDAATLGCPVREGTAVAAISPAVPNLGTDAVRPARSQ